MRYNLRITGIVASLVIFSIITATILPSCGSSSKGRSKCVTKKKWKNTKDNTTFMVR